MRWLALVFRAGTTICATRAIRIEPVIGCNLCKGRCHVRKPASDRMHARVRPAWHRQLSSQAAQEMHSALSLQKRSCVSSSRQPMAMANDCWASALAAKPLPSPWEARQVAHTARQWLLQLSDVATLLVLQSDQSAGLSFNLPLAHPLMSHCMAASTSASQAVTRIWPLIC